MLLVWLRVTHTANKCMTAINGSALESTELENYE